MTIRSSSLQVTTVRTWKVEPIRTSSTATESGADTNATCTKMIISWPGRVQPSTQTDFMCSFWDVMPTFREILNPKAKNQQMDGVSLLPLLENRKGQKEHEYLYFEFQEMNGRQAVRKGPWKLVHMNVRGKNPYYELYNLNSDPSERHNVLNQYPEKVTELKAIMQSSHIPNPNFPLLPGEK